jgi:nitrite reductase/ring-hydroxylating ferredoxin subunit
MDWISIGSVKDYPIGTATEIVVVEQVVAVVNVAGQIHAIDGVCPHQGGPLGNGNLQDCVLTCPWHGWQFDVRDGQSLLSPAVRHPTLPTRVDGDGKVYVCVSPSSEPPEGV